MQKIKKTILSLCVASLLTACGGGGSSSSSITGGDPTSPNNNAKVMQALSVIQTNAQLWNAVKNYKITMRSNLQVAGVGRAACAAHVSVGIVLNTEYINARPYRTAAACILHEALHLNAGHSGQTVQQEAEATAYASNGLKILGI